MKILYGVVGECMGHATRSHVVINHLIKNHEVRIVASKKAFTYLKRFFDNVDNIEGFEFEIDDNMLNRSRTLSSFIRSFPKKTTKNFINFMETCFTFSPDVIISDFESFSYLFGKFHDKPIISIDNMQIIDRCTIELRSDQIQDYLLANTIVKNKLPNCYYYLITTFFYPEVRLKRTSLVPPILRDDILNAKSTQGEHVLVYQTAATNEDLIRMLSKIDAPFIVYGHGKKKKVGNILFEGFSEKGFIKDLASARAVIASSGFSLIGEAVYLKKPYLSIPVKNQFEQVMNGMYLHRLGYGEYHMKLSAVKVNRFLRALDGYQDELKEYGQDGNEKLFNKLDVLLDGIDYETRGSSDLKSNGLRY